MNNWNIISHLPSEEPNADNLQQYQHKQLIAGISANKKYIFDAIYLTEKQHFVLTFISINDELGFIEQEQSFYPPTRQALLNLIDQYCQNPQNLFNT